MTTFDWQEQLKPILPPEWQETQGKGVKIAVLDSGLNFDHPAFKHLKRIGHRYNATLGGDRLLFGGNDDVSEQKTDGTDHGTPCLSIISGLQDGVFKGIAPSAEIFVIKVSRKAPNSNFEFFDPKDFLNGLKIAQALKVDFAVAALTFSEQRLGFSNLNKLLVNAALDLFFQTGIPLVCSVKNYNMFTDGESLADTYFPTWYPMCINCAYTPEPDLFEKLKTDQRIRFFWSNFKPVVYRAAGVLEEAQLSTSFATYTTAGVMALALAHLKTAENENFKSRNAEELVKVLEKITKPIDSIGGDSNLTLLFNQPGIIS